MRLPLDTDNVRAARMLDAGRVVVTFKSPSGQHITVKAVCKAPVPGSDAWEISSLEDAKIIWFEVPNSSGMNDRIGKYTQAKGFVPSKGSDPARVYCAQTLLKLVQGQPVNPNLEVMVSDHCGRCGRELTKPSSIRLGIGPECADILGYPVDSEGEHQIKVKTNPCPEDRAGCAGYKDGQVDRTFSDKFDLALARKFDTLTDDDLDALIRSTETARGKFAGNKLYVNAACKSERDRRRNPAPAPVPVTDKKGRELPKTFDELVARVG